MDCPKDTVNLTICDKCSHSTDMDQTTFSNSVIVLIAKLVIAVAIRFWRACTAGLLILLLCFWFYGSLVAFLLLIVALLGVLYNAQDMLLYYPDQPENSRIYVESPSTMGLPHDNIFITTKDGVKLNLVLIKQPPVNLQHAPTFIFLHGNAGNVGHRLLNAYSLFNWCQSNIVLVEYRGYGKSSGNVSEAGLYLDAEAAVDYISKRPDLNQNRIFLFGRSLGGAVAIKAASDPYCASKLSGLIVENTFTSIPSISRDIFNFKVLKYLPEFCYKNKFPSYRCISRVNTPTLFLSGLADTLIPPRMMQQLHERSCSRLKRIARFVGGTHNETWQCQGYYQAIMRFTQEVNEYRTQGDVSGGVIENASYTPDVPFNDGGVTHAL